MKVIGLDGKEYKWNLSRYVGNDRSNASSYHKRAREVLKELFPVSMILEEVTLPGTKEPNRGRTGVLYADFVIPDYSIVVEVHGEQHYNPNNFHFKNRAEFYKSQVRDRNKAEWCKLNNLTLIVLPYDRDNDDWKRRINSR